MANEETIHDGEIEEKIKMEAAKKAKNVKKEEEEDDEEEMKEGELPPALKKAIAKKKGKDGDDDEEEEDKKESKKVKKENDDDDEDDEEMDEGELPPALKKAIAKKKGKGDDDEDDEEKKEEIEVNVEEDVAALIKDEELSEEFKTKAATIFEAAVKSKISKIRKQIREESKKEQDERVESLQTEMTGKMDDYLNYATKEWMSENKLAVETGVRNEVTESFISGLKKLFVEHYIDVPEEKEDVFESLVVEVKELEEKLDAQTEKHMDTMKELNKYKASNIFKTVSEGMVDTDVEKLKELTEDVDYDTDEQYAEKLNVIKNSYFKSDTKEVKDNKETAGTNNPVVDGTSDSRMDSVMSAISHLSKK